MAFTTIAFRESADFAAAYNAISAVPDPHVFVSGDDVRIPEALTMIGGALFMVNDAVSDRRGRLSSPSLRSVFNLDFLSVRNGLLLPDIIPVADYFMNPIPVQAAEALNAELFADTTGAQVAKALVWLVDGPPASVGGPIYSSRFSTTITSTDTTWTNGAITFTQTLPVGRYQVVGMHIIGGSLTAGRLVFVGGLWRPGCPGAEDGTVIQRTRFRSGNMGVWGEFHTNAPPTIDVFGGTSGSQIGLLDLVRIG